MQFLKIHLEIKLLHIIECSSGLLLFLPSIDYYLHIYGKAESLSLCFYEHIFFRSFRSLSHMITNLYNV